MIVNNALSQNWVGCTPKDLGYAHIASALCPGRAHNVVSQCSLGAVSWPHSVVSQAVSCLVAARTCTLARRVAASRPVVSQPPRRDTKFVSRYNSCRARCAPCRACCRWCRIVVVPCHRALLRRIVALGALCCDTRPAPPATIQPFVSRHTPAPRA